MQKNELQRLDHEYIWHPYTDIDRFEKTDFPIIERGEGSYIYDTEGNGYIDAIASWWCVNFGHSHPKLVAAIQSQSTKLQNVILGGMSHENAILLSKKLAEITPEGLQHCFFASDGASSVEAALRMALQYWENIGVKNKKKFICLQDGYHGDTLGAVGVGYVDAFHHELKSVIMDNYRAASPHCARCLYDKHPDTCEAECFKSMEVLIEKHHKECAAVILEPLCQGAAGIRLYSEKYLQKTEKLCRKYDLLLLCDEIAVGFARTGAMFACTKAGITPDIMTIGKGVTGGYLPMSAAIANDRVYNSFRDGHTLYHGHTYCGNPIVSALAIKAIELYEEENILEKTQALISIMNQETEEIKQLLPNSYSYQKGVISMSEISEEDGGAERTAAIATLAQQHGVMLRPLGDVIYVWPPLTISEDELQTVYDVLKLCIEQTAG